MKQKTIQEWMPIQNIDEDGIIKLKNQKNIKYDSDYRKLVSGG